MSLTDFEPGATDLPKVKVSLAGGSFVWLPPLMTIAAVACLLTLHPRSVRRLIDSQEIAAHRVGADGKRRRYAVVAESIGAYLRKNVVKAGDLGDDEPSDDLYGEI